MRTIEDQYQQAKTTASDINEHVETLFNLAKNCKHITEFGVRSVVSTWAFLMARPKKLISYDIDRHANVDIALRTAKQENINFEFRQQNVLLATIEPTELLFIDTLHTYDQLKEELSVHADKVSKFLVFHDVKHFEDHGELPGTEGLMKAINEFIDTNKQWKIQSKYENNNGLLILEKV